MPAWPGPDCGADASGERQRHLPGAWRPVGRALGSEPPALVWSPFPPSSPPTPYLVRIITCPPARTPPTVQRGGGGPAAPGLELAGRHSSSLSPCAPSSPGSSSLRPRRAEQLASPPQLSRPCLQTWTMTSKRINCEYFVLPAPKTAGAPGPPRPPCFPVAPTLASRRWIRSWSCTGAEGTLPFQELTSVGGCGHNNRSLQFRAIRVPMESDLATRRAEQVEWGVQGRLPGGGGS